MMILPCPTNNLLLHITGYTYWVGYSEPNKSTYHIQVSSDKAEYSIKFINHNWHILKWGTTRWRTHVSKYFNKKDQEYLELGWYDINDPEHLDHIPLTNVLQIKLPLWTASVDYHFPRDPDSPILNKDKEEEEEKHKEKPSPEELAPRKATLLRLQGAVSLISVRVLDFK